jgi:hypothetical protein
MKMYRFALRQKLSLLKIEARAPMRVRKNEATYDLRVNVVFIKKNNGPTRTYNVKSRTNYHALNL